MIWILWQFIFLLLPIVLPVVFYNRKHSYLAWFKRALSQNNKVRKLYTRMLLVLILVFHYVYSNGHPNELGIILSTIVCLLLTSHSRTDVWLRWLNKRTLHFGIFACITPLIGIVPHLYTMSVTIAYILLAALFYSYVDELPVRKGMQRIPRLFPCCTPDADKKSDNHHANCRDKADSDSFKLSAQSTIN